AKGVSTLLNYRRHEANVWPAAYRHALDNDGASVARADSGSAGGNADSKAQARGDLQAQTEIEIRGERVGQESRQATTELETKPLRRHLGRYHADNPVGKLGSRAHGGRERSDHDKSGEWRQTRGQARAAQWRNATGNISGWTDYNNMVADSPARGRDCACANASIHERLHGRFSSDSCRIQLSQNREMNRLWKSMAQAAIVLLLT